MRDFFPCGKDRDPCNSGPTSSGEGTRRPKRPDHFAPGWSQRTVFVPGFPRSVAGRPKTDLRRSPERGNPQRTINPAGLSKSCIRYIHIALWARKVVLNKLDGWFHFKRPVGSLCIVPEEVLHQSDVELRD